MQFLRAAALAATLAMSAVPALAGKTVLSIDGAVAEGKPVDLSIEDLEAMGMAVITTGTPWDNDVITYEGVPMQALMEKVGASGNKVAILALNKYRTEVPLKDFSDHGVILAIKKNGEYMPVSDKGPLFVVYPFDAKPELKTELYFSRSAWQVRSMTVE